MENRKHLFFCFVFLVISFVFPGQVAADSASSSASVRSLGPPSSLTATAVSTNRIDLSWSSVSGAVSYKVYRGGVLIASSTATSYSDTGLSPGTSYSYTVSSINAFDGESEQSSSVSATTQTAGGVVYIPSIPPPSPLSPGAREVDSNRDGKINFLDFNILMINWGATGAGNIADFNNDGVVNIFDFNLLMIHWTE